MDSGTLITGVVLLVFGGLSIVRTDLIMKLRVWISKKIYGADYKPSQRTFQIQKIVGIVFVFLGVLILARII